MRDRVFKILKKMLIFPFIVIIRIYQYIISPWLPMSCRHYPTCSNYALEAFKKHGIFKGFYLATKRILKCHPWGTSGEDPVP